MKHVMDTADTDTTTPFSKEQCHTVPTDHQILAI